LKRLAILGSTGSIGRSTLDVVRAFPDRFEVLALAGGKSLERLEEQARLHRPACIAVRDEADAVALARRVGRGCRVVHGAQGLLDVATHAGVDLVVSALVGAVGLRPTYAALEAGRTVALANKETLVVAGGPMTACAARTGARILPVDSEHNALHQCLRGERIEEVRRLWLTASGGPFRRHSRAELAAVTAEQALCHPTWKMGPKVTVDSATLMNKGLEVIEAHWLFGVPAERVRVVIHPTSVVHSMVELVDGSFKAQLGITDMRHPIQYALAWPERWPTELPPFDPVAAGPLEFEEPDLDRFPCLALAYRALAAGGAAAAALNAANEVAVQAFLEGRVGFDDIPRSIRAALDEHAHEAADGVDELLAVDARARRTAQRALREGVGR
jgi:1-deoxy-D-xylulose-5-phosphate reductoisomerase